MYKPLQIRQSNKVTGVTSFMATQGENLRDLPQLLDPKNSLKTENYYITADGGLNKRQGISRAFDENVGSAPITMLSKGQWGSNLSADGIFDGRQDCIYFGFGTSVGIYLPRYNVSAILKNNFSVNNGFSGEKYGDYFYLCNGSNFGYFTNLSGRLVFSNMVHVGGAVVNVGDLIQDTTSGASGYVSYIYYDTNPAQGWILMRNMSGTFANGDSIQIGSDNHCICSDTAPTNYASLSGAPSNATTLRVIADRLYTGDPDGNLQWSDIFTGSGVPFSSWNTASNPTTNGGKVPFYAQGKINSIQPLGPYILGFCDYGKFAIQSTEVNAGNVVNNYVQTIMDRKDMGGARGAIVTPKGVFYVNSSGLWQLTSVGQPNIPFSDQEGQASILLGTTYFDNVDLSNVDLIFDDRRNTLLITCAKNSSINNTVITYHVVQQAFAEFTGWNINRFCKLEGDAIYGGSAITSRGYKVFDGYTDDGEDIWHTLYQELNVGNLYTRKQNLDLYVQGILSRNSDMNINYDIYDVNGVFVPGKVKIKWDASGGSPVGDGWGEQWGTSWGGGEIPNNLVESFAGGKAISSIRNFQRIRIKIFGHDNLPHQLNWIRCDTVKEIPIRRRNLTLANTLGAGVSNYLTEDSGNYLTEDGGIYLTE